MFIKGVVCSSLMSVFASVVVAVCDEHALKSPVLSSCQY